MIITNIQEKLVDYSRTLKDVISDRMPTYVCIKKNRNISKFQKIEGQSYIQYNKETLQKLVMDASWNKFYEKNNPVELWDFINI